MSQIGCLNLFLSNTLKNTQADFQQSWPNSISQLNGENQHTKHRKVKRIQMIAQAINSSSLKIKANQSSRSTLSKYIQGVVTPFETTSETLSFWPETRPDSFWQDDYENPLLSSYRITNQPIKINVQSPHLS